MFKRLAQLREAYKSAAIHFAKDASGAVTIIFSLLLVILCLFVGAAVDIGRWAHARHQTIQAMDAAVLAGGSIIQAAENPAAALSEAQAAANRYYQENTKSRAPVLEDTVTFTATNNYTSFVATGNAYIETLFLNFAHIPKLPLLDKSEASYSQAELTGGQGPGGGNSKIEVEIAMMLDVTGSMGGSKIVDLRAAAKDLVNIVISEGAYARKVRVALVPFSEGVRLPSSANVAARGTPASSQSVTYTSGRNTYTTTYNRTDCVVERTGAEKYTEAAPGTGKFVMTLYKTNGSCALSSDEEVVPLTSDKNFLNTRIGKLGASGTTAGHLGTAWAWYTLSPNWNTLWTSASNKAAAYGPNAEKIAILMTDGEYNLQYDSKGISTRSSGAGSAANGSSTDQAKALCTAMKQKGIKVYTVGFALGGNQTAINTLKHCASSNSTNYTADNGTELKQAFRDIARKISPLYLSH